jgi:hypothetical protein
MSQIATASISAHGQHSADDEHLQTQHTLELDSPPFDRLQTVDLPARPDG